MCDSYYEPADHWTDSCGVNDNAWSISVDERMASEPITYEDAVQGYEEESVDNLQETAAPTPYDRLIEYLKAIGMLDFEVRFDQGTKWKGCIMNYCGTVFMTLPLLAGPSDTPTQYNGFNSFGNVLDLVNHFRFEEGLCDLDEDQDPLDFIYVATGIPKTWGRLMREISNLSC